MSTEAGLTLKKSRIKSRLSQHEGTHYIYWENWDPETVAVPRERLVPAIPFAPQPCNNHSLIQTLCFVRAFLW